MGTFWLCVSGVLLFDLLGVDATKGIAYSFIGATGAIAIGWVVFTLVYVASPVFRARVDHRRERGEEAKRVKAQAVGDRQQARVAADRERYEAERSRLSSSDQRPS